MLLLCIPVLYHVLSTIRISAPAMVATFTAFVGAWLAGLTCTLKCKGPHIWHAEPVIASRRPNLRAGSARE